MKSSGLGGGLGGGAGCFLGAGAGCFLGAGAGSGAGAAAGDEPVPLLRRGRTLSSIEPTPRCTR